MLRNDPASYYTGSQDYPALGNSDHSTQPAPSQPEVSYLDYAHQRVPAALIQQDSTHYNINASFHHAPSMTGNTPLSHQRFHPYPRQSRSTTARDQHNLSLAAVMDSFSFSSSGTCPVNSQIPYSTITPSFPPTSYAQYQSSYNPSTDYFLVSPSTTTYPGNQNVPSQIENYGVPSFISIQHSPSHHTCPNTYTSELASALIPNTIDQDDSSDLIEVHSPMVDPALPYSSSDDALALSSDHRDSIPAHANQPSTTAPDGCIEPSSSYPSIGTAISSYPSAINELYSSFVASNMSQFADASHSQLHMAINGGQGNNIFGDQENIVYYQTDDPINSLWNEIANVGAHHDSGARFPPPRCHEGTRTKVQKSILDWAQSDDPNNEPLCWLSGPAGVGKSAIAQTIAETTNEGSLIASFFFWRGDPQRNNPSKLFLVIAHGLALRYPELRHSIGQVIREKPSILKASVDVQLQKLIIEPLFQFTTVDLDGLIIIDALDECSGEKEQRHVLCLIESIFSKIQGRLPRILLCSRPEPSIQETLSTLDKDLHVRRLTLDDDWESRQDIENFLNTEFTRIRNCDRCKNLDFPDPWPSPSQIRSICWNACGQFIYATTIIRFIDDEFYNPCEQLEKVLGQRKNDSEDGDSPFTPLDALYHQILSSYPQAKRKQLRDALGFLMYFKDNPNETPHAERNVITMEILYGLPAGGAALLLRRSRSLIEGVEDGAPRIIHKSFRDYLEDESRSHEFFIDKEIYSETFFSHLMLEAVIREAKRGFTCILSDQYDYMIAFTRGAFEYIVWSMDSTHKTFDTAEVYDFVIKLSLFGMKPLPDMLPYCFRPEDTDEYNQRVLSMHSGTTKNAFPVFTRLKLRIRMEGLSNEVLCKLFDIFPTLWMDYGDRSVMKDSNPFISPESISEFLDKHKATIIPNLCAFNPECDNYCRCSTPYWDSPVHLCNGHYIISPVLVLLMSAYDLETLFAFSDRIQTLSYWEWGLGHLFNNGEYYLKKLEIIEKTLLTKEWSTSTFFDWLLLSPIRLPAMGDAYHTRVLKCYRLLLDNLASLEIEELTSHFRIATCICGAEPELLEAFTHWFELFDLNCMDWCLEWLESFPDVHAKESGVAIAKFNILQQRWEDLNRIDKDLEKDEISIKDIDELLVGELARQDLDANDLCIVNAIIHGLDVPVRLRWRSTFYAKSWARTLEFLLPRIGIHLSDCDLDEPLFQYIEWIEPSHWPCATGPCSTASYF
ncbi:hypothetical protein VNI00_015009 [Paramarasmius palmivorus]|uniref:Nephrocystin 3-like N-terminal domain-containing protein n=1 Tax=Paramarasmius palmivorus TaxID=297713 RepID=A0AAW0BPH4_9AGAR